LRLLLDEHLAPAIAHQLRDRHHDVVAATEAGLAGVDDPLVLSCAAGDRRAVVTNNIKDFRQLHAASLTTGSTHYGIVMVPSGKYGLRRDKLGPLITALDRLLVQMRPDNALCDTEYFL
jgi:hypothetical protein